MAAPTRVSHSFNPGYAEPAFHPRMREHVEVPGARDYAGEHYLVRAVDTLPFIVASDELFEGLQRSGL